AGKLAAEVGMEADVVEGQEVPRLDRPPLVGAQRIAIEDGSFVGGEFRAQLDRPFQVLDQVVDRKRRVKFLESHDGSPYAARCLGRLASKSHSTAPTPHLKSRWTV